MTLHEAYTELIRAHEATLAVLDAGTASPFARGLLASRIIKASAALVAVVRDSELLATQALASSALATAIVERPKPPPRLGLVIVCGNKEDE